jgi:hypothetical protein
VGFIDSPASLLPPGASFRLIAILRSAKIFSGITAMVVCRPGNAPATQDRGILMAPASLGDYNAL